MSSLFQIITDSLNHASIIDGVRLSKAKRSIYQHIDMADLEERLKETQDARMNLIMKKSFFQNVQFINILIWPI